MKLYRYALLGLSTMVPMAALADFQYQETTQITGGSMLGLMKMAGAFSHRAKQIGEPIVSTIYVQGNRMARVNPQTITIIDLDRQTFTNIDVQKRTYTQMTFEQMRQNFQQAMQQATAKQSGPNTAGQGQPPSDVKLQFKVNVRNTGANKQVSGLNTNESILTMEMEGTNTTNGQKGAFAITNDMWLAPEVPGYQELRDFEQKFAAKMGGVFSTGGMSSPMLAAQPGMVQGMADMSKEVSKMNGVPVEQILRVGATANGEPLPAASEAPLPASSSGPQMPSAKDVAQQSAESAIASRLGGFGFGGFGHKKKQPPTEDAANTQQTPAAMVLMESQTQLGSFSSVPIGAEKFMVPTGFTQVQPPPQR